MFDLFRSRQKAVKYILGGLLTLVAVSMVVTLVPNYGSLGGRQDPTIIAEIGDEVLTAAELRKELARMRRNIPAGMEEIYIPMMVQQMISIRAVAFQAQEMGFRVTDQQLAQTIQSLIPQLWEGGKFAGKEMYGAYLAQQNLSIAEYEALVRKDILRNNLESLVVEGVVVTPAEVEDEFRRANEKVKVAFFSVGPELFKTEAAVSRSEIDEYWAKSRSGYQTAEKRSYLIFPIEEAKLAASIQIPDAELQRLYNSQQERFRTPERVRVRHILLKTTDKSSAEVAQIQKKTEDLLKQLKGGADFAELAKKNSEDTGSGAKGGDLEWVTRGQTVPEFETAAFSLKPGELSGVIKTVYGFHILRVDAKESARLRPFAEAKEELRAETAKGRVFDKMQTLGDQLRAALTRSAAEAEKLAAENGITPVRVEKISKGDPVPEVGANPQFVESATALPKNGVTPVISIGENKLVVAQVIDILPVRQAELSEVETQVRNTIASQKAQALLKTKIAELSAAAKQPGADLAALAKSAGVAVKTSEMVGRSGTITGLGMASQIEEAFTKNVGDIIGPVSAPGGAYFCKVLEKQPADLTALAAQRDQLLLGIKSRKASQRRELFSDGIIAELTKAKKIKIYEDNIKRITSAYRRTSA